MDEAGLIFRFSHISHLSQVATRFERRLDESERRVDSRQARTDKNRQATSGDKRGVLYSRPTITCKRTGQNGGSILLAVAPTATQPVSYQPRLLRAVDSQAVCVPRASEPVPCVRALPPCARALAFARKAEDSEMQQLHVHRGGFGLLNASVMLSTQHPSE